jgi:hypothetical protein
VDTDRACNRLARVMHECEGMPAAEAAAHCSEYGSYYYDFSAACGAAWDDWMVCLSRLDCAEIKDEDACPQQTDAFYVACGPQRKQRASGATPGPRTRAR